MKKQILNIGKALSRAEQKQVFGGNITIEHDGGGGGFCSDNCNCTSEQECKKKPCDGADTLMCVTK